MNLTEPFEGVDWWGTLALTGYLVMALAIGVILGMEFVSVAAYQPSPQTPFSLQEQPAWIGLMEAIRVWMMALAVTGLGTALSIDYFEPSGESA